MKGMVYEFASKVDNLIASLSKEDFCLRNKNTNAKRLIEELFPISRFALKLAHPGYDVFVEAHENSGPVDGTIILGKDNDRKFFVEVTYIYSYKESMRNELLLKTGTTPVFGEIKRDKASGDVIAESTIHTIEALLNQLAANIIERYSDKCKKNYPKGTFLIIAFDDPTIFGFGFWSQLLKEIDKQGGLSDGDFTEVNLLNCATNEMQKITYTEQELIVMNLRNEYKANKVL
jgi:hypothetical protein